MTEIRAETPHLREAPEQQQRVEHEDAIGDAGKDGKRVGAGFEKRMQTSSKFGISHTRTETDPRHAHLRTLCSRASTRGVNTV
jgi:hypothetical protein